MFSFRTLKQEKFTGDIQGKSAKQQTSTGCFETEERQAGGEKKNLSLGKKMNADLMLALDSDQEKLVGSHPEGDADT